MDLQHGYSSDGLIHGEHATRSVGPPSPLHRIRNPGHGRSKERLRHFWSYKRRGWGAKHFKRGYCWATHCRLEPVIEAAKTLKHHEKGLLSYFAHPITNAGAGGLNSRIQAIRVSARSDRNREHFKIAIYFHLSGLQLYPVTP